MDNKNDSLRSACLSITDSIGFSQLVDLLTHFCNHTLDLVLTYDTEISHLATMPHNPLLSDHYPITFNFTLPCNINSVSNYLLGVQFPLVLLKLLLICFLDLTVGLMKTPLSYLLTLTWLKLINLRTAFSSHCAKRWMLLCPLVQKKLAPWYNDHTRALKQALRKLERTWRSTNLQVFFQAWRKVSLAINMPSQLPDHHIFLP